MQRKCCKAGSGLEGKSKATKREQTWWRSKSEDGKMDMDPTEGSCSKQSQW